MVSQGSHPSADAERRVENLYRNLVESIQDYAIFLLDPDGRIASWNPGAERIKGYRAEEILGQHYRVFYPRAAREAGDPEAQLELAAREGRFEGEGWRLRKDGSRFWASVVITALFDGDDLIGFGKVTEDRTAERKAHQKLIQRERQLDEAQQLAHLGSWEYDLEGDRVIWSNELYRIFGMEPDSAVEPVDYLEHVHPGDRDAVQSAVDAAIEDGEAYLVEHRILQPDGEQRWVQSRGEGDRNEAGKVVRLVGTTLDITELKEAERRTRRLAWEQAARVEAERAAQRMGFLAEASALLGTSLDYRDTLSTVAWLAVPAFADLCAVDMVGQNDRLERLAVAHLDEDRIALADELQERFPDLPEDDPGVHEVLRTGKPELIEDITDADLERWARDDEHRELLERLGLTSRLVVPIRVRERSLGIITFAYVESGRHYGADDVVLARELAARAALAVENAQLHSAEREARKRAEQAGERTARLQAITAGLSEAVTPEAVAEVVVEQGTRALAADSGALVLRGPDGRLEMVESVGIPERVAREYANFDADAHIPLAEAVRTNQVVAVQSEARRARYPDLVAIGEETGTAAMVAVPLRSGDGVIGSLGFGYRRDRPFSTEDRDLLIALGRQCAQALERAWLYETEYEAREAAEEASRAKSQFVAMMSHELRTPLSAIIGYQELLAEEIPGPVNDSQAQHLDRIRASATHLRDLINQILGLSRIEAGREDVLWKNVDLTELARDVSVMMQQEARSKGLELRVRLPDEPLPVTTDPGKVRQILLNLLSNAIKFTARGAIDVDLTGEAEKVRLSVRDTGPGIAEADRERIFEVFTQVDQSMTRAAGGSGLGLTVSRRLARLLGGDIEVRSDLGDGSTFTLELPVRPD